MFWKHFALMLKVEAKAPRSQTNVLSRVRIRLKMGTLPPQIVNLIPILSKSANSQ